MTIKNISKKVRRISQINLRKINRNIHHLVLGKLVFAITIASLLPIQANVEAMETTNWATQLKLDEQSAQILTLPKNEVKIVQGESEYERKTREAAEKAEAQKKIEQAEQAKRAAQKAPQVTVAKSDPAGSDPFRFRPVYQEAERIYGVPWQIIEAVHQVETGKSGSTTVRSYAGAQGPMQFMPGTWRAYGVDGNGDGVKDATNVTDAIHGAARYLAANGGGNGEVERALFAYNHSKSYVNKVIGIARQIGYAN